jgi:hypothetical protein
MNRAARSLPTTEVQCGTREEKLREKLSLEPGTIANTDVVWYQN